MVEIVQSTIRRASEELSVRYSFVVIFRHCYEALCNTRETLSFMNEVASKSDQFIIFMNNISSHLPVKKRGNSIKLTGYKLKDLKWLFEHLCKYPAGRYTEISKFVREILDLKNEQRATDLPEFKEILDNATGDKGDSESR